MCLAYHKLCSLCLVVIITFIGVFLEKPYSLHCVSECTILLGTDKIIPSVITVNACDSYNRQ